MLLESKKFTLQTTDVVHYIVMFVDLAEQNPRRSPIRFPRSSSSSLHPREKKRKELTDEDQKKRNRERRKDRLQQRERGQAVAQADVYSRHGSGYNSIT